MENTASNSVDVQNWVDNFEAIIKSGEVKLIAQNGEVKLYQGQDGFKYIYDGSAAHSEVSEEFEQMKIEYFDEGNTNQ